MSTKKDSPVLIPNFYRHEPYVLRASGIGWNESDFSDARSDDPEQVFRYYIEMVGFNMAFYYLDDGCFYCIYTERFPLVVYRKYANPDWDGKYVIDSAIDADVTDDAGEVIYSTEDHTKVWSELKINGLSIGDVLKRSVIITLD